MHKSHHCVFSGDWSLGIMCDCTFGSINEFLSKTSIKWYIMCCDLLSAKILLKRLFKRKLRYRRSVGGLNQFLKMVSNGAKVV